MKKIFSVVIILGLLSGLTACGNTETQDETTEAVSTQTQASTTECASEETQNPNMEYDGVVYLGVENEGAATRADVLTPGAAVYRFLIDGEEKIFSLDCGNAAEDETGEYSNVLAAEEGAYPLQNILMNGYTYDIQVEEDRVISARLVDVPMDYTSVVNGNPGEKTLKNFLTTACSALGTVLYVYGGGWDFQDMGSSNAARTIGLSKSWIDFFNDNDADYQYKEECDGITYYPFNSWNTYYYAGLDCSAYVGWVLYNTMYTESLEEPGFVMGSRKMARSLAEKYGYGTWEHPQNGDSAEEYSLDFLKLMKPGDVVSLSGHVYIVVGTCEDGSVLIINSTMTVSSTGAKGGGVQLCAINNDGSLDTDCDAYRLAEEYNKKYFSEWDERYPATMKEAEVYTCFPAEKESTGIFHWNLENGTLTDPDGYGDMTAEEIMAGIFEK